MNKFYISSIFSKYQFLFLLVLFQSHLQAQTGSSDSLNTLPVTDTSSRANLHIIQNQGKLVATTPEQLLAGQVAGVRVTETNGTPGGDFSVQIRGIASLTGSNEPLYIIDGFPLEAFNRDYGIHDLNANEYSSLPNVLSIINPSDIESMEVIKAGSAIAMYGSRAAYGVVLIRTKRGRTKGLQVHFESTASVQYKKRAPDILSTKDFIAFRKRFEYLYANQGNLTEFIEDPSFSYQSVNWIDEATQTGTIFRQQLGLSGGLDFVKFSIQGGLSDQKGVVKNTGYDRKNVRLNLDFNFFKNRLRFGTSTYYATAKTEMRDIRPVYTAMPIGPAYNDDGSLRDIKIGPWDRINPLSQIQRSALGTDVNRLFTTQYAEIDIVPGLSLKAQYGITENKQDYYNTGQSVPSPTHGFFDHQQRFFETNLNYRYAWKNKTWTISAGYGEQKFEKTGAEAHGSDQEFVDRWLREARKNRLAERIEPGKLFTSTYVRYISDTKSFFLQSSLSAGNWQYQLNARRDSWSATFNSVGGSTAWQVPDKKGWLARKGISSLRLVADYGYVSPIFSIWTPDITQAFSDKKKIDRHLMSLGGAMELLHGRINLEIEFFNQLTNNARYTSIIRTPQSVRRFVSASRGLYSRGMEISGSAEVLRTKDLTWKLIGNFTAMANRIRHPEDYFGALLDEDKSNQPIGSIFGKKNNGIWNSEQEILDAGHPASAVESLLGNTREVEPDHYRRKQIGSALPNVLWGLSSTLEWRKFDVSILIRGENGQRVFNGTAAGLHPGVITNTSYYAAERAWAPDRTDNQFPRQGSWDILDNETWYWEKAGFVRLQNLAIGYTLSISDARNIRIFLSGQNLLLLTKYRGWDPEVNFNGQDSSRPGLDYGVYPRSSTLSMGLQLHL